jgi:hypothetical protein
MRHLAVLALALSFVGCADEGKQSKVTMCHNTSSATNPVVMITVANASQRAHHENHGDYEAPTWYADMDGDGLGDASDSVVDCEEPSGFPATSTTPTTTTTTTMVATTPRPGAVSRPPSSFPMAPASTPTTPANSADSSVCS